MHEPASASSSAVRLWLRCVAALIFAMVLVGGATRLTESGLSIVEWRPITGVIPPLSESDWRAAFAQYQTIPQYQTLNKGMTLDDFKTIYWWEWGHRLLGRIIGAVFLLPFLYFLWRGLVPPALRSKLWGIFGLGAFQGAVGWWMVASGLADRISVSQYRLAFHLTLACVIYAAVIWAAEALGLRRPVPAPRRIFFGALVLLGLVFLQIYAGALVAGLDAGLVYNTWPLIDGTVLPPLAKLFSLSPGWRNIFENDLTVQFLHRMIGYVLLVVALAHAADVLRTAPDGATRLRALALAGAVILQAALGVTTLLLVVPIGWALAHQAGALLVLTLAVLHVGRLAPLRERASVARPLQAPVQGQR